MGTRGSSRYAKRSRTTAFATFLGLLRGDGRYPLRRRLLALPRLLVRARSGAYRGWDRRRAAAVALGLLYVVSPVDLVPEAVLGLFGLADDAVLLAWLAGAVLDEVDSYLDWERRGSRVVSGDVVG